MTNYNEQELLKKYSEGKCSEEELRWIEAWYGDWNKKDRAVLSEADLNQAEAIMRENVLRRTNYKTKILWSRIAAAASIILVLGAGLYFYRNAILSSKNDDTLLSLSKHDIPPGSNKATLTLANGEEISLSDVKNGDLANENNMVISKTADGQIIYTSRHSESAHHQDPGHANFNTMTTPKGGQYNLVLSDGTKVILNAASSLKYPVSFRGSERKVELTGEAYFIVKHNAKQPFRVESRGQIVEDIGTEFNINAYTDESTTKTTLIEGAARIVAVTLSPSKGVLRQAQHDTGQAQHNTGQAQHDTGQAQHDNSVVLKPNQQSMLTANSQIKVTEVNTEEAIAWKNGEFMFNNEALGSIMKKLARWYDIEVQYKDNSIEKEPFWGTISRFGNVSDVLTMLELTKKVHFKIAGRRIIVTK